MRMTALRFMRRLPLTETFCDPIAAENFSFAVTKSCFMFWSVTFCRKSVAAKVASLPSAPLTTLLWELQPASSTTMSIVRI